MEERQSRLSSMVWRRLRPYFCVLLIPQNSMFSNFCHVLKNKTLVIYVRSNDPCNIPHFHIVDKTTLGNKFHTCIKIETSEYFHHTGKEDVLNSKERKQLLDFLNYSNELGVSNWRYLLLSWNTNNSTKKVNMNIQMPDYTNIK